MHLAFGSGTAAWRSAEVLCYRQASAFFCCPANAFELPFGHPSFVIPLRVMMRYLQFCRLA